MPATDGAKRNPSEESTGVSRALALFILGFSIALLGVIIVAAAALSSGGSASYGAVIFIGPIPIVFGAGPQAAWLILIAIMLAALSIIFLLSHRRTNRSSVYSRFSSLP